MLELTTFRYFVFNLLIPDQMVSSVYYNKFYILKNILTIFVHFLKFKYLQRELGEYYSCV